MRSTLALLLTGAATVFLTSGGLAAQTETEPTCENTPHWVESANYKEGDAVVSTGQRIWVCKGGAATASCGDKRYEPDRYRRASEVWQRVTDTQCQQTSSPEIRVTNVVSQNITCNALTGITLTATLINDSGFHTRDTMSVAFYHSAEKIFIGRCVSSCRKSFTSRSR